MTVTPGDLARRALELLEGVTEGPVGWFGNKHHIYLATKRRGRQYVMGFRRFGMNAAQPVFNVNGILKPAADLVTFEVGDKVSVGFAAAKEDVSVYRYDVSGIDHPDARFIAECFELVPALAAGNTALREALDSLLPGPLCGEAWGLPDTEKVAITVTFGAIRFARALSPTSPNGGDDA